MLVTGAGGSIGRWAGPILAGRGYRVTGLSRTARDDGEEIEWIRGDLLEPGAPTEVVARAEPTHLLHLAWHTDPADLRVTPRNLDWLRASLELVEAFGAAGGRRAVIAGTAEEYGESDAPRAESGPINPVSLYGASKHDLHIGSAALAREAGFALAWARIFAVYGPGDDESRLIPAVAGALLRGEPAPVTEGTQVRDFIYSRDAAEAIAALLDSDVEGPVNIGTGEPRRVRDVAEAVGELLGAADLIRFGEREQRHGEPDLVVADTARLREEVGFSPATSFEQGLRETIDQLRREG